MLSWHTHYWSQARGFSIPCCDRSRGCDPNSGFSHLLLNYKGIHFFICRPNAIFHIFLTASRLGSIFIASAYKPLFTPTLVEVMIVSELRVLPLHFQPPVMLPYQTLIYPWHPWFQNHSLKVGNTVLYDLLFPSQRQCRWYMLRYDLHEPIFQVPLPLCLLTPTLQLPLIILYVYHPTPTSCCSLLCEGVVEQLVHGRLYGASTLLYHYLNIFFPWSPQYKHYALLKESYPGSPGDTMEVVIAGEPSVK